MLPVAACIRVPKVCLEVWKDIVLLIPTFLAILLRAASTLAWAGRWKTLLSLPRSGIHAIAVEQMGTALRALVFFWKMTSVFVPSFLWMSDHLNALMSLMRSPVRQANPKASCVSRTPFVSSDVMKVFSSSGVRNCLWLSLGVAKVSDLSIW